MMCIILGMYDRRVTQMSYFTEFVFGSNLAIHKPVIFSYSYKSQSGIKAVDGDPRGDSHRSNTCVSYYQHHKQPAFLRIDLEHVYPISHVDIFPATYRKNLKEVNKKSVFDTKL